MPEPTFGSLFNDTAGASWPTGADVRHSARRAQLRARAAGLAAAVTAIGMVGAGAVAINERDRSLLPPLPAGSVSASPAEPTPSTTPSPTASTPPSTSRTPTGTPPSTTPSRPPLTSVPVDAMLGSADLGPGQWTVDDEIMGEWTLTAVTQHCKAEPAGYVDSNVARQRGMQLPGERPSGTVTQRVHLHRSGAATAAFNHFRAVALACARYTNQATGSLATLTILAEGFAGQRSMVVESRDGEAHRMWVFIVHGNLLSEVAFTPPSGENGVRLGKAAAKRLCAVQGSCG